MERVLGLYSDELGSDATCVTLGKSPCLPGPQFAHV